MNRGGANSPPLGSTDYRNNRNRNKTHFVSTQISWWLRTLTRSTLFKTKNVHITGSGTTGAKLRKLEMLFTMDLGRAFCCLFWCTQDWSLYVSREKEQESSVFIMMDATRIALNVSWKHKSSLPVPLMMKEQEYASIVIEVNLWEAVL